MEQLSGMSNPPDWHPGDWQLVCSKRCGWELPKNTAGAYADREQHEYFLSDDKKYARKCCPNCGAVINLLTWSEAGK